MNNFLHSTYKKRICTGNLLLAAVLVILGAGIRLYRNSRRDYSAHMAFGCDALRYEQETGIGFLSVRSSTLLFPPANGDCYCIGSTTQYKIPHPLFEYKDLRYFAFSYSFINQLFEKNLSILPPCTFQNYESLDTGNHWIKTGSHLSQKSKS